MPFLSESQRRYCWVLYTKAKKEGKEPQWDCRKWEHETTNKNLPYKIHNSPKSKKSSFSLCDYGYKMSNSVTERHKSLNKAINNKSKEIVLNRLNKLSILYSTRPQIKKLIDDINYVKKSKN